MKGKMVARIWCGVNGREHLCPDDLGYLDERGPTYRTKADAYRRASELGYTHVVEDEGVRVIPKRYRGNLCWDGLDHRGSPGGDSLKGET